MKRVAALLAVMLVFITVWAMAYPAAPGWWTANGTAILTANISPNNTLLLNLGQLRNVASKAQLYLNNTLVNVGGAGAAVNSTVDGVTTGPLTGNLAIANLGQLKYVAKPIYDRLLEIGYDTRANLIARGAPADWAFDYPWDPSTPVEMNYAPANLGQLKFVFSFDLDSYAAGSLFTTGDADSDTVANYIEILRGTNPNAADTDGDGTNDNTDVLPLDAGFSSVPSFSASHPNITLTVPVGASLFSTQAL